MNKETFALNYTVATYRTEMDLVGNKGLIIDDLKQVNICIDPDSLKWENRELVNMGLAYFYLHCYGGDTVDAIKRDYLLNEETAMQISHLHKEAEIAWHDTEHLGLAYEHAEEVLDGTDLNKRKDQDAIFNILRRASEYLKADSINEEDRDLILICVAYSNMLIYTKEELEELKIKRIEKLLSREDSTNNSTVRKAIRFFKRFAFNTRVRDSKATKYGLEVEFRKDMWVKISDEEVELRADEVGVSSV